MLLIGDQRTAIFVNAVRKGAIIGSAATPDENHIMAMNHPFAEALANLLENATLPVSIPQPHVAPLSLRDSTITVSEHLHTGLRKLVPSQQFPEQGIGGVMLVRVRRTGRQLLLSEGRRCQ